MKRKGILLLSILILAIFLTGCNTGGLVTPATDEAKIKSVINEYFLAINDQNWSKAKNYCVYGSDRYYAVCQTEDLINTAYSYCNIITINAVVNILDLSISGNYSQAYCYVNYLITYCGYYEADEGYSYFELQKVGNSWKLY
jgi:hypothetical protein